MSSEVPGVVRAGDEGVLDGREGRVDGCHRPARRRQRQDVVALGGRQREPRITGHDQREVVDPERTLETEPGEPARDRERLAQEWALDRPAISIAADEPAQLPRDPGLLRLHDDRCQLVAKLPERVAKVGGHERRGQVGALRGEPSVGDGTLGRGVARQVLDLLEEALEEGRRVHLEREWAEWAEVEVEPRIRRAEPDREFELAARLALLDEHREVRDPRARGGERLSGQLRWGGRRVAPDGSGGWFDRRFERDHAERLALREHEHADQPFPDIDRAQLELERQALACGRDLERSMRLADDLEAAPWLDEDVDALPGCDVDAEPAGSRCLVDDRHQQPLDRIRLDGPREGCLDRALLLGSFRRRAGASRVRGRPGRSGWFRALASAADAWRRRRWLGADRFGPERRR